MSRTLLPLLSTLAVLAMAVGCTNTVVTDTLSPRDRGDTAGLDVRETGTPSPGVSTPGTPPPGTPPPGEPDPSPGEEPPAEPTMMESTKADLVWKRYRAVERDLMRGLGLDKSDVCQELGTYSCVDEVHLAPLGGNEPFEQGQYEPVAQPTATTAIALERVVLAACANRAELDATGTPELFTDLDLDAASVDDTAADATTTTLYQNLLSRDPEPHELERVRALTDDEGTPVAARDFATLACFSIGTTAEAFFY